MAATHACDPRLAHHPPPPMPVPSSRIVHSQHDHASPAQHHAQHQDSNKPFLPSIANLLDIADASPSQVRAQPAASQRSAQALQSPPYKPSSIQENTSARRPSMPPTPPMRSDSVIERGPSPSTISSRGSFSGPHQLIPSATIVGGHYVQQQQPHYHQLLPNVKPMHPVQHTPPVHMTYAGPHYIPAPVGVAPVSYYGPEPVYTPGVYGQQPLPSSFQPAMIAASAGAWEHPQYMNVGYYPGFAGIQERYICPTCKKAFSRPSSLQIHSHSHTGEKPFKCPRRGCGKAFSVRSNMKRHERGCHSPEPAVPELKAAVA